MAPNKRVFAIKRVTLSKMNDESRRGFLEEVDLLQRLKGHPGIIQMYHYESYPREEVMMVVLEHGEIDLNNLLRLKRQHWAKEKNPDPFVADPHFVSALWRDMLRSVQVRSTAAVPYD
jgi:serine/threonine-protein kinase TTK/MPS1